MRSPTSGPPPEGPTTSISLPRCLTIGEPGNMASIANSHSGSWPSSILTLNPSNGCARPRLPRKVPAGAQDDHRRSPPTAESARASTRRPRNRQPLQRGGYTWTASPFPSGDFNISSPRQMRDEAERLRDRRGQTFRLRAGFSPLFQQFQSQDRVPRALRPARRNHKANSPCNFGDDHEALARPREFAARIIRGRDQADFARRFRPHDRGHARPVFAGRGTDVPQDVQPAIDVQPGHRLPDRSRRIVSDGMHARLVG